MSHASASNGLSDIETHIENAPCNRPFKGEKQGLFRTSHFPGYSKSFFSIWDSDWSHDSDESV
jgi:hypothetical protein